MATSKKITDKGAARAARAAEEVPVKERAQVAFGIGCALLTHYGLKRPAQPPAEALAMAEKGRKQRRELCAQAYALLGVDTVAAGAPYTGDELQSAGKRICKIAVEQGAKVEDAPLPVVAETPEATPKTAAVAAKGPKKARTAEEIATAAEPTIAAAVGPVPVDYRQQAIDSVRKGFADKVAATRNGQPCVYVSWIVSQTRIKLAVLKKDGADLAAAAGLIGGQPVIYMAKGAKGACFVLGVATTEAVAPSQVAP